MKIVVDGRPEGRLLAPLLTAALLAVTSILLWRPWEHSHGIPAQQGIRRAISFLSVGPAPPSLELLRPAAPEGFDWHAYRFYNPGIEVDSEAAARAHYEKWGFLEGRLYRHVPITLRYPAGGGLCNQLYAHLDALTVADQLRADDVVVPPSMFRASFAKAKNWTFTPPEAILDLERMRTYWEGRGIRLYKGPMLSKGQRSMYKTDCLVVDVPVMKLVPLQNATREILGLVHEAVGPVLKGDPRRLGSVCVHVQLANAFVMLHGAMAAPAITNAARGVFFPPMVVAAAKAIVQKLPAGFMGVHLRIEGDWTSLGRESPMQSYIAQMKAAGFNSASTLYVASGIFAYQNATEIEALERELKSGGVFGKMLYKELLAPDLADSGFNPEQVAMVDLLVLSEASAVVGHCWSTFSWFVREQRALHGLSKDTFRFVDHPHCSKPGTKHYPYFHGGLDFV